MLHQRRRLRRVEGLDMFAGSARRVSSSNVRAGSSAVRAGSSGMRARAPDTAMSAAPRTTPAGVCRGAARSAAARPGDTASGGAQDGSGNDECSNDYRQLDHLNAGSTPVRCAGQLTYKFIAALHNPARGFAYEQ
jgi:hypothetical protein